MANEQAAMSLRKGLDVRITAAGDDISGTIARITKSWIYLEHSEE